VPYKELRSHVQRWGSNATCWQIFNPGIRHWVDTETDTLVGYRQFGRGAVAVGDPIGPPDRWEIAARKFESGFKRVVWFGASVGFASHCPMHIPLGFQTVIDPRAWTELKQRNATIRYQINRSKNKGVMISRPDPHVATPRIIECLREWQAAKFPIKLYFMTDPGIAADIGQRSIWIAEQAGQLQGYLIASPIPQQQGWLFEQWVRRPGAPNGIIEQLIDTALTELHDAKYATMGLCPLTQSPQLPLGLGHRILFKAARTLVSPFYRTHSLTQFKLKFGFPIHEPIYAAFSHPGTMIHSGVDAALAFIIAP